ncbi:hypothetical protein ACFP47_01250 [Nesterenkonia lacusekhoensis]|uniref:Uncharacterized protein n=1 Tax=Nesterenkonia lacusekhoensis TaxID=150832 RepID=A0ABS4T4F9_9MICC|nr:hypothetical protein [Nesterenkonia lacusekhoensis]MBP2319335.1 hypothetical protein [Nesterenkonia lacusekhoensis]
MQHSFIMRPSQANFPLQPSRSLHTLHPRSLDEEIAERYVDPPLLELLRWWEESRTNNFLAGENQYVNDERASLLREVFEKLIPLVEASTPDWISIQPYYPKSISPAGSTP